MQAEFPSKERKQVEEKKRKKNQSNHIEHTTDNHASLFSPSPSVVCKASPNGKLIIPRSTQTSSSTSCTHTTQKRSIGGITQLPRRGGKGRYLRSASPPPFSSSSYSYAREIAALDGPAACGHDASIPREEKRENIFFSSIA